MPQLSITCQRSTLAKVKNPQKKKKTSMGSMTFPITQNISSFFRRKICPHIQSICRATTRPPRPSSTTECLRLIARLRGEQASAASWEPRPPFEAAEMD